MNEKYIISPVTGWKIKNLIGEKFGRLTVMNLDSETMLNLQKQNKRIRTYWLCKCDCGNEELVSIVQDSLTSKNGTRSCGCLQKESLVLLYKEKAKDNSFAQYLIDTYGDNALDLYWSNKNTLNPWNISSSSSKNIWVKCKEKDYHEDYKITCASFGQGKRCPYCGCRKVHPKDSFAQWCIDNIDKDFISKYWSDKNTLNPFLIAKATKIKVWIKCIEHEYHEDYLITCGNFINSSTKNPCSYCRSKKVHILDSLGTLLPQSLKYWSDKNTKSPYEYSCYSNDKVWFKCIDCGFEKEMAICDFSKYSFVCNSCGDGFSYPSKFMFYVLNKLPIDFITEYNPSWCKYEFKGELRQGYYDFYFESNNKKYIIETDGRWHNDDNNLSGQTAKESKLIDDYKDKLAKEHGIEVVRINCEISSLKWIKSSIMSSILVELFDLSQINWSECVEFAVSSRVKEACELWNSGVKSTTEIAKIMNISGKTVREYLKQGTNDLKWCNYITRMEITKSDKEKTLQLWNSGVHDLEIIKNSLNVNTIASIRRYLNEFAKKGLCNYNKKLIENKPKESTNVKSIIIVETNQKFNSLTDLSEKSEELFGVKFSISGISSVCSGRKNTLHGYHIMYYSDYLEQQLLNQAI